MTFQLCKHQSTFLMNALVAPLITYFIIGELATIGQRHRIKLMYFGLDQL